MGGLDDYVWSKESVTERVVIARAVLRRMQYIALTSRLERVRVKSSPNHGP